MKRAIIALIIFGACQKPATSPKSTIDLTIPPKAELPQNSNEKIPAPMTPIGPKMTLEQVTFESITGYREDNHIDAIKAFNRSCKVILAKTPSGSFGKSPFAGRTESWQKACNASLALTKNGQQNDSSEFFETHFNAYRVKNNGSDTGRFTGYYEAHLKGSLKRTKRFSYPVYKRPKELVMVNMLDFTDSPKPRRIAGKVINGRLRPFYTRKEIDEGALSKRNLEIAWVDSPIDRLFAQIQGSALLSLPGGKSIRLAYSAKNGHPYTAIGRELAQIGAFEKKDMSMQSIRKWLLEHPEKATEMMQRNKAYVFFKKETRPGAIGAQNVVLTPERSMAVDPYYIPLGAPLFLQTELPQKASNDNNRSFKRIMIAQDTGGAIRGPIRGDVFWGNTDRAFEIAGQLKSSGSYYLFLPKDIVVEKTLF